MPKKPDLGPGPHDPTKCGRRLKTCRKCGHKYSLGEHALWLCPSCGDSRKCTNPAVSAGRPCRLHGGKTPGGPASVHWRGRGQGKWRFLDLLPDALGILGERMFNDTEILALNEEIVVTRLLARERFQAIRSGGTLELWTAARAAYDAFRVALETDKADEAQKHAQELGGLLRRGVETQSLMDAARREFMDIIEGSRKLADTEIKRREKMEYYMTVEQANVLAAALAQAVLEVVKDPKEKRQVIENVMAILQRTAPAPLPQPAE